VSTALQLAGETSSGPRFWSADPQQLSIDPNGNLTQKTEGSDTWTYEWDAENRLKRVLKNNGEQARFAYDALGRRVEKVAGGVTSTWTYDGEAILRETSGSSTLKYVHGSAIDQPLAREDGTGVLSFLHADALGSIIGMTNSSGAVIASRRYDAFGNLELGAVNGYAFTGREWDSETGLAYYRARYYDPKVGRFISEDPIGFEDDYDLYAYVRNNPNTSSDPSGLGAVAPVPKPTKQWPAGPPCATTAAGAPIPNSPPGCIQVDRRKQSSTSVGPACQPRFHRHEYLTCVNNAVTGNDPLTWAAACVLVTAGRTPLARTPQSAAVAGGACIMAWALTYRSQCMQQATHCDCENPDLYDIFNQSPYGGPNPVPGKPAAGPDLF